MLSLIWADSGAITTFSILKNSSDSLAIAAENEFQFKLKEISNQKSNLESSISDLNEEELDLITDGVRSNSIDSVGSISEIFNELKTESDTLAQLCSSVQLLHSHSTEQSYLSNSLVLADKIKEDYSSLLLKSSLLKNYSEVVVIQKHQEASDEIADT